MKCFLGAEMYQMLFCAPVKCLKLYTILYHGWCSYKLKWLGDWISLVYFSLFTNGDQFYHLLLLTSTLNPNLNKLKFFKYSLNGKNFLLMELSIFFPFRVDTVYNGHKSIIWQRYFSCKCIHMGTWLISLQYDLTQNSKNSLQNTRICPLHKW